MKQQQKHSMTSDLPQLLTKNDPPPVEIYNRAAMAQSRLLIICDHASNIVPEKLGLLGIEEKSHFNTHIALDVGAKEISCFLADHLDAPAILAGFSRLVLDLNRATDHDGSIPEISDDIEIPGNKNLTDFEKQQRINALYAPYHKAVADSLDTIRARGEEPFVISIHSFTPVLDDEERLTEIGILWDGNTEIAHRMIEDLNENNPGLIVGSNDPYSFIEDPDLNHSLRLHNIHHGKGYMLVEFRQDMADTPEKAQAFAEIFLNSFRNVFPG